MAVLTLRYACCAQRKPYYLNKSEIEAVAQQARAQLLPEEADAMTLEQLAGISGLVVNDLPYQLWVRLDHPVTDEGGQPVLGVCEYDPGCGEDAISVLVSPVGNPLTPELALSTLAHELGHAIFDAPAWLESAKQGLGLLAASRASPPRSYRTITWDRQHLDGLPKAAAAPSPVTGTALLRARIVQEQQEQQLRWAEYRANEFMGALLVPRQRLIELAVARASRFEVGVEWGSERSNELHAATPRLVEQGDFGFIGVHQLQYSLAITFGVTPKFIRVRMQRYGLLPAQPEPR